jgi:ribosomal-protein-alanine N-acetyltransferase
MTLDDLPQVQAVERLSFPTPWPLAGYRRELTQNEQAYYVVLVLRGEEGGERVVGYAGHWLVRDEVHISTIAVHPEWRGQGLGALLLLHMLFHALEHEAVVVQLEVRENNVAAQRLYERFGFEKVGRRKKYYRDTGEDALLMDLDLTQATVRERLEEEQRKVGRR